MARGGAGPPSRRALFFGSGGAKLAGNRKFEWRAAASGLKSPYSL